MKEVIRKLLRENLEARMDLVNKYNNIKMSIDDMNEAELVHMLSFLGFETDLLISKLKYYEKDVAEGLRETLMNAFERMTTKKFNMIYTKLEGGGFIGTELTKRLGKQAATHVNEG